MKYRSSTPEERREIRHARLSSWHKIFVLWPRRLTHDRHEVCWMQFIYRKGIREHSRDGSYWIWQYAENEFDILKIDEKK